MDYKKKVGLIENLFKFSKFPQLELFNYPNWIVKNAETIWHCGYLAIFSYWFSKLRQLNIKKLHNLVL
jgi:hypothetical protein